MDIPDQPKDNHSSQTFPWLKILSASTGECYRFVSAWGLFGPSRRNAPDFSSCLQRFSDAFLHLLTAVVLCRDQHNVDVEESASCVDNSRPFELDVGDVFLR